MTVDVVGLVPIRGFRSGKTRLAETLSTEARAAVSQWMLRGVIRAALAVDDLAKLAVISPDPSALEFARAVDDRVVPILQHDDQPGLNRAVAIGRDWALDHDASGLLVAFGDLPLLMSADVQTVLDDPAQVVVAPDRHGTGTNLSLVRFQGSGTEFVYQYGPGSARRHEREAARSGLTFGRVSTVGTGFDLDTLDDLQILQNERCEVLRFAELRHDSTSAVASSSAARERS
ncbi:MAG: 2-phospho-L-lactate guanylyltransferase [Chloroflexia bacterium]|nr:2-phospho-L-lactate guanylyltransferase [Chloroflexia bacterium]MDQ3412633.1 2-phospho-L-lactate guanylyltransferase [Chloroflexota bacterium]